MEEMDGRNAPEALALQYFKEEKLACSESVLLAMARHWGVESDLIPRIATPFRAGLAGTQAICGVVTGGLMAIGLRLGRDSGSETGAACVETGKAFLRYMQEQQGTLECRAITGLDFSDHEQHERFQRTTRGTVCAGLLELCCRWLAENVPER